MSKAKTYTVHTEPGCEHFGVPEGAELELTLADEREFAYVAAGWLEPTDTKEGKK